MKVSIKKTKSATQAEVVVDEETIIVWNSRQPFFILKFRCMGTWYHQWLTWRVRGEKGKYYRAMSALYRTIRHAGLTNDDLHRLAG